MHHRPIPNLTPSVVIRLWKGILIRGPNDCWPWVKGCDRDGYGIISVDCAAYVVTRVLWKHWHSVDPDDLLVCHNCNNPPCCNPNHLYLGTDSENLHYSFDCNRRFQVGEFGGCAKLTNKDVKIIREELDSGRTNRAVALERGVHESTISKIKWRKSFK